MQGAFTLERFHTHTHTHSTHGPVCVSSSCIDQFTNRNQKVQESNLVCVNQQKRLIRIKIHTYSMLMPAATASPVLAQPPPTAAAAAAAAAVAAAGTNPIIQNGAGAMANGTVSLPATVSASVVPTAQQVNKSHIFFAKKKQTTGGVF